MPETGGAIPARHVAAVVVGNALEFYDFLTYAFFAVYIGRAFFPSSDPTASLLASLGTFGVGFVTRPIGGFVIGRMGDRLGRKPAMVLSFSLMGVAIVGLAVTPPLSMIGIAAPALVIFFRMVQGFALGGEVGPTTAFLLEAAPPGKRGFYAAFQAWTQDVAVLSSGLVGFALANLLNAQQLQDYGWRIAFLVGAAIVPFGVMMRRSLPETYQAAGEGKRERLALRPFLSIAVLGLMLLASATISTYVRSYMTTYAISTLHMRANVAFGATVIVGLCGFVFDLLAGSLSDRIGRKLVMLIPALLLLVLIFPVFHMILHYRSTLTLLGGIAVLSTLATISTCPVVIWLAESLPAPIRSGGVAIVYAVAIATFGGTTQYAVTWLIRATGSPLAPAWYWMVSLIVGLIAILAAHESAPRRLGQRDRGEELAIQLPDQAG
ncbi:MAG TPA: MFS transporter [Candidatus Acidoferrales bacterium]|jgi:MFS family permease|nr:MFS transporter [Candidatus Acidoferrales bacterium]